LLLAVTAGGEQSLVSVDLARSNSRAYALLRLQPVTDPVRRAIAA